MESLLPLRFDLEFGKSRTAGCYERGSLSVGSSAHCWCEDAIHRPLSLRSRSVVFTVGAQNNDEFTSSRVLPS